MKNIIVPIDFSDASLNAASYAAALAKHFDARIILFHTFPLNVPNPGIPFLFPDIDEMISEHRKSLDTVGKDLSKLYGIKFQSICRPTPIIDELKILYKHFNADLIVMGMRGMSLDYKLFGSITVSAIREGKFPVLAVPTGAKFKPIDKILFACENSCIAPNNKLIALRKIANVFNAKIQVLQIEKSQLVTTESKKDFSSIVNIDSLLNDLWHEYKFLEEKNVIQGIERGVNEFKPDILTMIPHKLDFWGELFNRGKTDKVAYHTQIPLLTLPNSEGI